MRLAGAVLTGGASRRMGTDKALVDIAGAAMAVIVARALAQGGCHPVVAIGGDAQGLGGAGLAVVADLHPGEGPLGGILTALDHVASSLQHHTAAVRFDGVVVVACDLPGVDAAVVSALAAALGDHDVAAARDEGPRPLCAAWSLRSLPALRASFAAGERAVRRATAGLDVVEVAVAPGRLRNVNTPADLEAVRSATRSSR